MNKKIIGIVGKPDNIDSIWNYIQINNDIKECLNRNNALVIGIIPQDSKFKKYGDNNYELNENEINDLESIINKVDGIVLQGGLVSNSYEKEIIKICLKKDLSLLCICGGFNNLVETLGGKLSNQKIDLHNKYGESYAHDVIIKRNSKLFKILGQRDNIMVNSIHHKVAEIDSITNCKIVGVCPLDNTVEAIEVDNKRFAIGVKWHPELMEEMNSLFESFIQSCK